MDGEKSSIKKIVICFVIFFFLSLNQNINKAFAQENSEVIEISIEQDFNFTEFAEDNGENEEINSLFISLPEGQWNLTDIYLNFTNIKLNHEIKTVEDQPSGFEKFIYKKNPSVEQKTLALGVQLELSIPTKIYGVFIYGRRTVDAIEPIFFQINGYNEINHRPNNTIYKQIYLNLGTTEDWYYQNFSTPNPISLNKGNYSLVMNGSLIPEDPNQFKRYYWMYNNPLNTVPLNPNLYISEFANAWSNGIVNSTFLYKIAQKANVSCFPSDINMVVEIDGQTYDITNNTKIGLGTLSLSNINFRPNNTNLHIPINYHNYLIGLSLYSSLNFSYFYHINLTKILYTEGFISIRKGITGEIYEGLSINWTLNPEITRVTNYHVVQFKHSNSWYNFEVFRNDDNITSDILFDSINHYITIHNDSIENDAEWEIKAKSLNVFFQLDIPDEIEIEKLLDVSIKAPILPGTYNFIMFSPNGINYYEAIKRIPPDDNIISFEIPGNWTEGEYKVFMIWNNQNDAGIQVESIKVVPHPTPFPWNEVGITAAIIVLSGVAIFTLRRVIKKRKTKHEEYKKKILSKCSDMLNLNYILVADIKSGLTIYEQELPGQKIDSSLISGFLQAINNFGIALTDTEETSQSIKLDFKNLKILMSDSKNFRLIFILKENPSQYFTETVKNLMEDVMVYYGTSIENFKGGSVKQFMGIRDLIEKHLQISFIYPLKVVKSDIKLSGYQKSMVRKALEILKLNNLDHFYVTYLIPDNVWRSKDVETILSLIDNGIFQSII